MIPSFSIGWPRIFLIPVRFKTALRGVAPRRRMYLGLTFAISFWSQTEQAFISATFGVRFPGGRHLTVFVMYTFRLLIPAAFSILFKSFPESPTKGFPSSSRSEEHTSELQSRENLVCRLLLEKKKN